MRVYRGLVPLSSDSDPVIDGSKGNCFSVTLTADRSLTFSNPKVGETYVLIVTQDGTGGRQLTAGLGYKIRNRGAQPSATERDVFPSPNPAASSITIYEFVYTGIGDDEFYLVRGNQSEGLFDHGNVTGTVTIDGKRGRVQRFIATGAITLQATDLILGQEYHIEFVQNAVGGHALTLLFTGWTTLGDDIMSYAPTAAANSRSFYRLRAVSSNTMVMLRF